MTPNKRCKLILLAHFAGSLSSGSTLNTPIKDLICDDQKSLNQMMKT